jgi:hypothetical protein
LFARSSDVEGCVTPNAITLRILLIILVVLGCYRARGSDVPGQAPGAAVEDDGREGSTLEVENSSIFDVRMFVVRGAHHVRLGLVTSGRTDTFPLPAPMLNRELVFYAEPVGSRARQRTDPVYVRPGQHVKLALEKQLRSYSIAVH